MKISFKVKRENIEDGKLSIKANKKFVFEFEENQIHYKMFNVAKVNAVMLIGSLNKKNYFWISTMPYKYIYQKYPLLGNNKKDFDKYGFKTRILEALYKNEIKPNTSKTNIEEFKTFIK